MSEHAIAQPQKIASLANTSAHAGLLQRKCACGGTAGLTGQCDECSGKRLTLQRNATIQAEVPAVPPIVHAAPRSPDQSSHSEARSFKGTSEQQVHSTGDTLKLGEAGNSLERQADEMAAHVLRMPVGAPLADFSPASEVATGESLPADVTGQINRTTPGGESLDRSEQEFFAPKFGHDFSKVRVHRDAATASLARRLDAVAFTVGSHVFFNSGAYQPSTESGRRLLAHELAHVVQQERGLVSRQVQRASIPYRQVTWADFKGSVPASSAFAAETSSGFSVPVWKPKVDITDTKEACEVDKKKSTKHTATLSVDPAVFDTIKATMDQDKSWVRLKYKDPDKHCPTVTTQCETEIDKQAATASKTCKQEVKPCQEAFDKGEKSYSIKVEGTDIVVTSKADCATTLVSSCEKASAKRQLFELTEKCSGTTVVKATSKADCSAKKFKEDCLKYYKDWSARLLKHEQGHFDISNIMAGKALADLKVKATKYTATATECGKRQANNEAVKQFDALNAPAEIAKRGQDWIDLKNKAEKDYDDQTDHGCKLPEQATWEKAIAAKLTAYDLNKPVTPAVPAKQGGAADSGDKKPSQQAVALKLDFAAIADQTYKAIAGPGTDEEAVYRALQKLERDPDAIKKLKDVYRERHKLDLVEDIRDDFSGEELEYALQLLNMGTKDSKQRIAPEPEDPKTAARRIREAVQGPGTDEEAVYAALLPFRRDTLKVQRAYQEEFQEDLRDRIEDEMSGSELDYALDLLETPFERYVQEASTWLKRFPSIGFGLPWNRDDWFDGRFWKREFDAPKKEWKLVLEKGTPHEAIDALFHEQGRWHVDCAVFVEVVQLYALRQSLGAKRFDQRIGKRMELRAHGSTGTRRRTLFKRDSPTATFTAEGADIPKQIGSVEEVLAEAPIGSRVRWTSQLLFDKANNLFGPEVFTIEQQEWPNWQHENTVKLGPDSYGAHGVGNRVNREKVESKIADITADVFPNKSESEIRAGIFISEIELFERPDLSEQIEPSATDTEKGPRP